MKLIYLLTISLCLFATSCKTKYEQNAEGFKKLSTDLESKFGKDAWYTSISLSKAGDGNEGYIVAVDKTDDPSSLKQERWVKSGGMWEQAANVTVEVKGGQPSDFMFRLNKEIDLSKLGEFVTTTKKTLEEEKKITNATLKLAIVSTNNTILNKSEKINYTVILTAPEGGNTYSYTYNNRGELVNSTQ